MNPYNMYQILITGILSIAFTIAGIIGAYNYLPIVDPINKVDENCSQDKCLGTTVTTINGSDTLKDSRTVINDNFTALNTGKIEVGTTSVSSITTLPGLTTASALASVGTITSGVWSGTTINVNKGGTGQSNFTANSILIGNGTSAIATTSAGTDGQLLTFSSSSAPYWSTPAVDQAADYAWTGDHSNSGTSTFTGIVTFSNSATYGAGFTHMQVYTASSTWTKPAGVAKIKIKVVGGGGNGGNGVGNNKVGTGGGGGGCAEEIIDVSATSSVAVVVGLAGETSSFGNFASSTGGSAGASGILVTDFNGMVGGAPGAGYNGDINITGSGGGFGDGVANQYITGGNGGGSCMGGGGSGGNGTYNGTGAGSNGGNYGGGGGGGINASAGGAGAQGVVIIEY